MKKILFLFLISFSAFGQEKFSNYHCSYVNKDYDILVTQNKDNSVKFYIECMSMDKLSKDVMIVLEGSNIADFKKMVGELKEIHSKWTQTAIENKVTEINKDVEDKSLNVISAFTYGGWNFDFSTALKARFTIVSGKHLMLINSDELVSSKNKYMKCSGLAFAFEKANDFDSLISQIDEQKAIKFFEDKKSKQDLFKN